MRYDVTVVLEVEAETLEEAEDKVEDALWRWDEGFVDAYVLRVEEIEEDED